MVMASYLGFGLKNAAQYMADVAAAAILPPLDDNEDETVTSELLPRSKNGNDENGNEQPPSPAKTPTPPCRRRVIDEDFEILDAND